MAELITLDEAKEELEIHSRHMDRKLARAITDSIRYVERHSQTTTLRDNVTYRLSMHDWPTYNGDRRVWVGNWLQKPITSPIRLGFPPYKSLASVTYYDSDNVEQTVAAANYRVTPVEGAPAKLEFDDDYTFPTIETRIDAVNILFNCGASIPESLARMAAFLMLHYRIDGDMDARKEADSIIQSIRVPSFGLQGITKELLPLEIEPVLAGEAGERTYAITRSNSTKGVAPTFAEVAAWLNPYDSSNQTYSDATLPTSKGANVHIGLTSGVFEQWELTGVSPETWVKVAERAAAGGEDLDETRQIGEKTTTDMEYTTTEAGDIYIDTAGKRWRESVTELGETKREEIP